MPTSSPALSLTPTAIRRIQDLQKKDVSKRYFRISVEGGGCNGFQYKFSFASTQESQDTLLEIDGVQILIDDSSLAFIEAAEIDFVEEMIGSYFQVKNPNATTSCGCGNSFSI